jgi:hypothetical protein
VSRDLAIIIAPLLGLGGYDATSLCSTDPPPDPGLNQNDLLALLEPQQPLTFYPAVTKVNQWFKHNYWCIACQCDNGTNPNCGTPSNPGPISTNPGMPGGTSQGACWQSSTTEYTAVTTSAPPKLFSPELLPGTLDSTGTITGTPTLTWQTKSIPPGVQQLTATFAASGTRPYGFTGLYVFDAAGNYLSTPLAVDWSDPPSITPNPVTRTATLPANAHSWIWEYESYWGGPGFNQPAPGQMTTQFSYTCSTTPNQPVVPCCPPDPSTDIRLRSIQEMLMYLTQHGSASAVSHIDGTRHAGLSGAGTVTLVAQVDAIRVEVKSNLAGWPLNPGTPNYYLSMGFITSIAVGSPLKGWRLVYQSQTFPIVLYADQIGYTLPPGITVDIVELLPQ